MQALLRDKGFKAKSFARAAAQYRALLREPSTFEARTLEQLIATEGALDAQHVAALEERYLVSPGGG